MLLVYYAGHGLLSRRRHELHLALTDTPADEPGFGGIPSDVVRDTCVDSPAACKIVILDCCFSGRALGRTQSSAANTIAQVLAIEGAVVLASVPPNALSVVLDGEPYPAFSGGLLRLLREGWPGGPELLSLPYIHQLLQQKLKAVGLRLPQIEYSNTAGQLALCRNRAPHVIATAVDAPPTASDDEKVSTSLIQANPMKAAELLTQTDSDLAAKMLAGVEPHTAAEVLELMKPHTAADILIAMRSISAEDGRNDSPWRSTAVLSEMESVLGAAVLSSMDSDLVAEIIVWMYQYQCQGTGTAVLRTDTKIAQLLLGLSLDQAAAAVQKASPGVAAGLLTAVHQHQRSAANSWAVADWIAELVGKLDLQHSMALLNLMPDDVVAECELDARRLPTGLHPIG